MKNLALAAMLAALATSTLAADVGVSLSIGEPGFYGRLDIGDYPQPQLIYRRPTFIGRVEPSRPPLYLRVPPGHARHWSRHCREYDACGERVYFVQDNWYRNEYVPRYQMQDGRGEGRREGREERRHEERRDEQRGERRDHSHDSNRNESHGNDRGHNR